MEKIQEIVPVSLKNEPGKKNDLKQAKNNLNKSKVALEIRRSGMDITVYNGCNNYILNAALGVLNSHAN